MSFRAEPNAWFDAIVEAMAMLVNQAGELGANAVVGLECQADPFAIHMSRKGLLVTVLGTAAKLERMF